MIEKSEEKNSSLRESTHPFEVNNKSHIIFYNDSENNVDEKDLEFKIRIEIYKSLPAWRKGFIGYILGDFHTIVYKNSKNEEKLIRIATTKEADQAVRLIDAYVTQKENFFQSAINIVLDGVVSTERIKELSQSVIKIEIPPSSKEIMALSYLEENSVGSGSEKSIFLPKQKHMNSDNLSNKNLSQQLEL